MSHNKGGDAFLIYRAVVSVRSSYSLAEAIVVRMLMPPVVERATLLCQISAKRWGVVVALDHWFVPFVCLVDVDIVNDTSRKCNN